ncbi:hypothetical protein [Brachybacterium sacelli]|uniref:Uncharacterized protein n=1 Tax=Brachybacterium sacelli TaxID=173364 RepID=A0ABS4X2L9_9MICO|nr:hypothetical protein [Brachybacterium sacelli]MBP2382702.1 hypothetical protein [Brachybacterium sacelli]
MTRRHQIRTVTALGLAAPLLVGLSLGAGSVAGAQPAAPTAPGTQAPTEVAHRGEHPTDLFTTGPQNFSELGESAVPSSSVAQELGDRVSPDSGDDASCDASLDVDDPTGVAACTVTGYSGTTETYYAYVASGAVADVDYELYFAKDTPLSSAARTALNDGSNGTGVYPVFDETDGDAPQVLEPSLAVDRANYVLDGIGRDDLTVRTVQEDVDLRVPEPVSGTAVEEVSGRTVGVTLLPITTQGEAPALLVSIDGP